MRNQVALGIDISESRISLALLMGGKNGAKLLKAGSAPVPEGAIKDDSIEQPEVSTPWAPEYFLVCTQVSD